MIKLRISQKELEEIINDVLEKLHINETLPSRVVFGEMLNREIITEGLITTYSPNDTINILNNSKIKFYNIRARRIPNSIDNKTIYNIVLYFDSGLHNIGAEYYNNIIHLLDVCGWFPSIIYANGKKLNDIDNSYELLKNYNMPFDMICEAKFDVKVDDNDLPDKLYHITNTINLDKINKNGLTPKNKIKVSYHPERVYFFDKSAINNFDRIAKFFYELDSKNNAFTLLEVDTNQLRSKIDFYYDGNTDLKAFYSLEPISPLLIKKIKEITL